jgi:preprotein translocase subunit SecD
MIYHEEWGMITLKCCNTWFVGGIISSVVAYALAQPEPKVGATLTYELADEEIANDRDLFSGVITTVNDRIEGLGIARPLSDDTFAVDVYGDVVDADTLDAVRRLVTTNGAFEFRILASRTFRKHQSIIALATELPADADVVELDGVQMARWIAVDEREFPDAEQLETRGLVARDVRDHVQALLVTNDGLDVTGDYLESVSADVDESGRPQMNFTFNDDGAFRLGRLTEEHLPTFTGQRYSLGIVFDDRLLAAPTIESKITDRGRISGNMSEQDVDFLVTILSAGRLPCDLREVGAAAQDER